MSDESAPVGATEGRELPYRVRGPGTGWGSVVKKVAEGVYAVTLCVDGGTHEWRSSGSPVDAIHKAEFFLQRRAEADDRAKLRQQLAASYDLVASAQRAAAASLEELAALRAVPAAPAAPEKIEAVAAVVVRRDGKILLIRNRKRGVEIPGGKILPGESYEQAVVREVMEETGMRVMHVGVLLGVDQQPAFNCHVFHAQTEDGFPSAGGDAIAAWFGDPTEVREGSLPQDYIFVERAVREYKRALAGRDALEALARLVEENARQERFAQRFEDEVARIRKLAGSTSMLNLGEASEVLMLRAQELCSANENRNLALQTAMKLLGMEGA